MFDRTNDFRGAIDGAAHIAGVVALDLLILIVVGVRELLSLGVGALLFGIGWPLLFKAGCSLKREEPMRSLLEQKGSVSSARCQPDSDLQNKAAA